MSHDESNQPLRIFIGFDHRQPVAYNVLQHSLFRRSSKPLSISPLVLPTLPMTRQGLYAQDYDTVERAARDTDDPYGLGNVSEATTTLTSSLAGSVSFIQSLPKIGTSATDKLMGLIINSIS